MDIDFTKYSTKVNVDLTNAAKDQSTQARKDRLKQCNCPIHDTPLLQCDVWYRPNNAQRYTFIACSDPMCRFECIVDGTFTNTTLTKSWQFLLEQDDTGTAKILTGSFGR